MDMDPGIQAFAEESHEMLEEIENILLKLEDEPDDSGLINELFRAVHTIKGASGLFGFDNVMNFTHTAESVMMRVRDGAPNVKVEGNIADTSSRVGVNMEWDY